MPAHGPTHRIPYLLAGLCLAGGIAALVLPGGAASASAPAKETAPLLRAQEPASSNGMLLYYAATHAYEAECVADLDQTTDFPAQTVQELDTFCAAQGAGFSVCLQNLATGESYLYGGEEVYYPASLLKVPFALWLCQRADAGELSLGTKLPNLYRGQLAGGPLDAYDAEETVPAQAALEAMLTYSDNHAVRLLANCWPLDAVTMADFLQALGCPTAQGCAVTVESGLDGAWTVQDAAAVLRACYTYFAQGGAAAAVMRQVMCAAPHKALYFPSWYEVAKKYGSWDYAFHDMALCYAPQPYLLVCMTNAGDRDVDFPPRQVETMQALGKLASRLTNP